MTQYCKREDRRRIGECLPRHRAKEFIRFLKKIDRTAAKPRDLHLIADNYTTHKTNQGRGGWSGIRVSSCTSFQHRRRG